LLYGREAAHTTTRIVHAHGDATGAEVERTAIEAIGARPNVTTYEQTMASHALVIDGHCVGLDAVRTTDGARLRFVAGATILATGGIGSLYLYSTNPPVATADGIAVALRAGCALQDMEFVQFHPTALASPGYPKFLISEAVRGEGAVLVDQRGQPFMRAHHEQADLAPRDIVAREIVAQMRRQGGAYVRLDFSPIPPDRVRRRFPGILEELTRRGFAPLTEPIPVTPAAHYMMGGIACDLHGRTTVPRLFACGECASYGVHGANRLASNSLLDGVVFGSRTSAAAVELGALPPGLASQAEVAKAHPLAVGRPEWRDSIQQTMWNEIGIIRSGKGMRAAERLLADLCAEVSGREQAGQAEMEAANMAQAAWLIATAALTRQESRGAHHRTDYPATSDAWRRHITLALQPDGTLRVGLRPVLSR
jgi:L-aspartate oxidase